MLQIVATLCALPSFYALHVALGLRHTFGAALNGVLAAQTVKPQARVLAEARGIAWVEVDLAELRGEREPALTLFAA